MSNVKRSIKLSFLMVGLTLTIGMIKAESDLSHTLSDIHEMVLEVKKEAKLFFEPKSRKTYMEHVSSLKQILDAANKLVCEYANPQTEKEALVYDILNETNLKLEEVYTILVNAYQDTNLPKKVYNLATAGHSKARALGRALECAIKEEELKRLESMVKQLRSYLKSDAELNLLEQIIEVLESFEKERIVPKSKYKCLRILQTRLKK